MMSAREALGSSLFSNWPRRDPRCCRRESRSSSFSERRPCNIQGLRPLLAVSQISQSKDMNVIRGDTEALVIVPLSLAMANAFVKDHHRHRGPVIGHRFSLGVVDSTRSLRGVAIIGRPVARQLNQESVCEVTRLATDGCRNASSKLYAAASRVARDMGFARCVTYTLVSEFGTSLRAAGWRPTGITRAKSWNSASRPRIDLYPLCDKVRWEPRWSEPSRECATEATGAP